MLMVIADGVVTNLLIQYGIAHEGNPFLLDIAGGVGLIIIKIIGASLAALIIWDIFRHYPRLAIWVAAIFVLLYSGIVDWNLQLLFFWI